ncbi:MAG: (d)CMP kinase [Clostridia bacterium]|nr:(d)CMP kinase [Clostridia bacterium]
MFSVTIDGKAGCGKSTVAKELSKRLGFKNFNTGAVYRAITCEYKNVYNEKKPTKQIVEEFVKNLDVKVIFEQDDQIVLVNNNDYTKNLRDEEISNFVALISPFDQIRQKVRQIQREFAKNYDCVMEGRDIGTVVLPNAQCKLFITASNEVRAQRRLEQLKGTPDCPTYDQILQELYDRDYKDVNREHGALLPAEDGIIIDNSNETLEQTLDRCEKIVKEIKNK